MKVNLNKLQEVIYNLMFPLHVLSFNFSNYIFHFLFLKLLKVKLFVNGIARHTFL